MALTFFQLQAQARNRTWQLLFLYACAIILIVFAVYIVVWLIWLQGSSAPALPHPDPGLRGQVQNSPFAPAFFEPQLFTIVALSTILVILLGSLYKTAALGSGGPAVAESLGGRIVDPSTTDADERRALNVIEEMAIASGIPVPPLFILDKEEGINAFAAGFTPADAVIGLTRGCIKSLTRDELQGVAGHEFSHILNGDMRLNIRLIGVLFGIFLLGLIGRTLMRIRGDREAKGIALIGLGLYIAGYLGVFFGRLIQAAVSRQREYLADASSIQFTRNPPGLAGALKKIAGLLQGAKIESLGAEQASHMFFAQGRNHFFSFLFATHPPLKQRIKRIDPSFTGEITEVVQDQTPDMGTAAVQSIVSRVGKPGRASLKAASAIIAGFNDTLCSAARNELGARSLIIGLILCANKDRPQPSQEDLYAKLGADLSTAARRLCPDIEGLKPEQRIALVDLCMPALRRMTNSDYRSFRENVDWLTNFDGKMSFFEYALSRVAIHNLDALYVGKPQRTVKFRNLEEVKCSCIDLLAHLAVAGSTHRDAAGKAFVSSLQWLDPSLEAELPDPKTLSLGRLDAALKQLDVSSIEIKEKVMNAAACCVACDGVINVGERELIRAVGSYLDCPVPAGAC